ncbi:hypothetical protein C8F04DRAFT_1173396 [Mycena alexandri]|uniref:Uncharacterized protein n=1 Tax=Mycena alexandri TaxID=1745969 RepID=A0AAD6XFP0_9AGAR|nr:hypothetical protein C8F04DRAFT_1173396 [Mycena alexandri]
MRACIEGERVAVIISDHCKMSSRPGESAELSQYGLVRLCFTQKYSGKVAKKVVGGEAMFFVTQVLGKGGFVWREKCLAQLKFSFPLFGLRIVFPEGEVANREYFGRIWLASGVFWRKWLGNPTHRPLNAEVKLADFFAGLALSNVIPIPNFNGGRLYLPECNEATVPPNLRSHRQNAAHDPATARQSRGHVPAGPWCWPMEVTIRSLKPEASLHTREAHLTARNTRPMFRCIINASANSVNGA